MPTTITCPSCGGEQTIPEGNEEVVCTFCGNQFTPGNTQIFPLPEINNSKELTLENPSTSGPGRPTGILPEPAPLETVPPERVQVVLPAARANQMSPAAWIAIAVLILFSLCFVCSCLGLIFFRIRNPVQ